MQDKNGVPGWPRSYLRAERLAYWNTLLAGPENDHLRALYAEVVTDVEEMTDADLNVFQARIVCRLVRRFWMIGAERASEIYQVLGRGYYLCPACHQSTKDSPCGRCGAAFPMYVPPPVKPVPAAPPQQWAGTIMDESVQRQIDELLKVPARTPSPLSKKEVARLRRESDKRLLDKHKAKARKQRAHQHGAR